MDEVTGRILLVQEGRFRLLRDDGAGQSFALAPGAGLEPQDLPALRNRRVRVRFRPVDGLLAGAVHALDALPEER